MIIHSLLVILNAEHAVLGLIQFSVLLIDAIHRRHIDGRVAGLAVELIWLRMVGEVRLRVVEEHGR